MTTRSEKNWKTQPRSCLVKNVLNAVAIVDILFLVKNIKESEVFMMIVRRMIIVTEYSMKTSVCDR